MIPFVNRCASRPLRWGLGTALAAVTALAAAPALGVAQLPRELPPVRSLSASPVEQADSLFLDFQPATALAVLEAHLADEPNDYGALWRAARAGVVWAILEGDDDAKKGLLGRAGEHGEAAVAVRPTGTDGLYWTAAALGREALQHGPRSSTRLVQRVWELTRRLLEVDPEHAGGHNVLGKLNQEVMSLSGFERFIGRLLFRIDPLEEASWDKAVHHHEQAVASDPEVILFRMDLGATYMALERWEEARAQFEAALDIPPVYPVDPRFKDDVRRLMEELPDEVSPGAPRGR
jgi:tetratricopeptide (TPR) repeat protein